MESLEICDAQSIDRFRSSPLGPCTGGLAEDQLSQVKSGDLMRFRDAELRGTEFALDTIDPFLCEHRPDKQTSKE